MARQIFALGIVLSIQWTGAAVAQETGLQEQLQACARLQNSAERLGCYDRVVAGIGNAAAAPAPTSPETMFGVGGQLSRETVPAKQVERAELQSISAQIKALRSTAGSLYIELDNGQTWQQVENTPLLLKVGNRITITRGAFNSFRLNTEAKRTARVKRVQ